MDFSSCCNPSKVVRRIFLPTRSTRQSFTAQMICFNELRLCSKTFRFSLRTYKKRKQAFDYCKKVNLGQFLLHHDQKNDIWFPISHLQNSCLSRRFALVFINRQNIS